MSYTKYYNKYKDTEIFSPQIYLKLKTENLSRTALTTTSFVKRSSCRETG